MPIACFVQGLKKTRKLRPLFWKSASDDIEMVSYEGNEWSTKTHKGFTLISTMS